MTFVPSSLLLLPLFGVYWFIQNYHYLEFRAHRLDGNRLLLESVIMGPFFTLAAWILVQHFKVFRAWLLSGLISHPRPTVASATGSE